MLPSFLNKTFRNQKKLGGKRSMKFIMVYITTKDRGEAVKIGRTLVDEKLAACVNIVDGMNSLYRWQGEIVEDNETILIAKSREERFEKILSRVKELHSYTVPCVVGLPLTEGNPDYLQWLREETE
ncbi:Periplasmic divalent cation tolerance protein CutA [Chitinispirillum alkaliphilum]|nr:Periplasmic divalent cation tolerance protein CutA [Chitinispirillum alkaliphilum]